RAQEVLRLCSPVSDHAGVAMTTLEGTLRRFLPHRLAGLVLALCVAASLGAGVTADRVVDENEAQLLRHRTSEVARLLQSLGISLEAQMASVAAVVHVTDGDPEEFRRAVAGVAPDAAGQTVGGWALMRRTDRGFAQEDVIGLPAPVEDLPTGWRSGLE